MTAGASTTTAGRVLGWLDAIVPPPATWAFAGRIWLAMVLSLYAAFWLQLESPASAAATVAILAHPKRGGTLSKALYRVLGTVVGGAVSVLMISLSAQDRVWVLLACGLWLAACSFVAQYLQDNRSYGAVLAGYTVAFIALANIDTPQDTFVSAISRVAAILTGVVAVTVINDALGSPSVWRTLVPRLTRALAEVQAYVGATLMANGSAPFQARALTRALAPLRSDADAISGELDDGASRAAGARSALAALYEIMSAAPAFARMSGGRTAALDEARAICTHLVAANGGDPAGPMAARRRLQGLLDACVRSRSPGLREVAALQRAVDLADAAVQALDGLASMATGLRPMRAVSLPAHRDVGMAVRAGARAALSVWITAAVFVAAGIPQVSLARRCCMDRRCGRADPSPVWSSGDADGVRASQLQHAVEDMDGDLHLGRPPLIHVRAQPVADHLLEARNARFGQGAPGVARRFLPGHAAAPSNVPEMAVALRGCGLGRLARHRIRARRHDHGRVRMAGRDAGGDTVPLVRAYILILWGAIRKRR